MSNSSTGIIQNNDNNECVSENPNELNKNVYPSQKAKKGKQNKILEESERRLMRRQKYKERKQKESAESREERLMKLRERRKNQSLKTRETRLSGRHQRAKQAIIN